MNLISIIVPCYNQAHYLNECLESVLEQTYTNWECIIVNDGSPDNTADVAKKWVDKDSRFLYLYKSNGGLSSARNEGLKVAKGDYIQFLDSDDILEMNKINWQSQFFDKPIDILISGYRYFENSEGRNALRIMGRKKSIPEIVINFDDHFDVKNLCNHINPFVICAPLYKKKVIEIVGFFNETLTSLEDWDYNLRCALHNMVFHHTGYSENSKVLVRLHDSSMMRNKELLKKNIIEFKEQCYSNELYITYFGKKPIKEVVKKKSFKRSMKKYLILLIPPILILLKNKIFKK